MKITIIVPCYNAEPFLKECLESCLNQNFQDYEVIFVDNESTDKSLQVALELKKVNDKLQIYTAPNIYKYSYEEPVNEGMKRMTGEYFTIVGADDCIHPEYLSNVYKFLVEAKKPKCIQSGIIRVLPDGRSFNEVYNYKDLNELKNMLLKSCCVLTPTVFFHRSLYDEGHITWDSEKYLGASDYDLYCQLVNKGIFINPTNSFLGYIYRMHKDQSTWGMVDESSRGNHYDKYIKEKWSKIWIN